ncbi:MAG: response regulator [Mongoliibacter sp.]|uniref:response regulator n=1 Tax=Mongoliibacter sp. TaxID=2022438 RepID=UPI0012F03CEB|nr:response regulator [Mongoliibacter sp.]TVP45838.1 MAG: response regulator [Mongoliibacter sp.]
MNKPIHILLVEDNEGDILLTTEALEDRKISIQLSIARDGQEALDFIFQRGKFENVEEPDLILLDINLPKKNGHEVLQIIKSEESYKHIPILMLSTSSSGKDIVTSYKNHANCFITKPVEVDNFQEAIASVEEFWMHTAKLPKV